MSPREMKVKQMLFFTMYRCHRTYCKSLARLSLKRSYKATATYLVINFLLYLLSYAALIASDATKEQSDTIVYKEKKTSQDTY